MKTLLDLPNFDTSDIEKAMKHFSRGDPAAGQNSVVMFAAIASVKNAEILWQVVTYLTDNFPSATTSEDVREDVLLAIGILVGMIIYTDKEANAQTTKI